MIFVPEHLEEEVDNRASWTYLWANGPDHEGFLALMLTDGYVLGSSSSFFGSAAGRRKQICSRHHILRAYTLVIDKKTFTRRRLFL